MTKTYPNFYENVKEANLRLQYTIVMYDNEPYYVLCITDGKPDDIFRVYLEPIGKEKGSVSNWDSTCPHSYPPIPDKYKAMDDWMEKNPDSGVIRKTMNSPHFNRFRPFRLGMCNYNGNATYLERQPQRHTQQGLTQQMICQSSVSLVGSKALRSPVDMHRPEFRECLLGQYPSIEECILGLSDTDVMNDSVAFHRDFALIRGPVETLFLVYKSDVIGILPKRDTSEVCISAIFSFTKEVVFDLDIFKDIRINN